MPAVAPKKAKLISVAVASKKGSRIAISIPDFERDNVKRVFGIILISGRGLFWGLRRRYSGPQRAQPIDNQEVFSLLKSDHS